MNAAVFLDRDGVLIEDVHLLTRAEQIHILPGVPEALSQLKAAGFQLIVVSNQTVVARGMATEEEVHTINQRMAELLKNVNGPLLDAVYICPHHPSATLPAYRMECECRKPRPGLFLQAARERDVDLKKSFAVGDRITDIIAGAKAGCRTVLVQTGKHTAAPIESSEPIDQSIQPDYMCADLAAAAKWIVGK
jgi:D-glycero-D-manno-heptose 1,7-bisphosphate phosphatase